MSWTKRQFITQALEEIGMAAYVFDLQPEQIESAHLKLNSMMAGWKARGIEVNYAAAAPLDESSGVPDVAYEAIYKNLALLLAPSYGKAIQPDTRITAKQAYDTLIRFVVKMPSQRLADIIPAGAGNKLSEQIYLIQEQDN